MPLNYPKGGHNFVGEFTISGLPWSTSSTTSGIREHTFPRLASHVFVKNRSSTQLNVAFTFNAFATNNFIPLAQNETFDQDVRCASVWVSGSANGAYAIYAEITTIPTYDFLLTGSLTGSGMEGAG